MGTRGRTFYDTTQRSASLNPGSAALQMLAEAVVIQSDAAPDNQTCRRGDDEREADRTHLRVLLVHSTHRIPRELGGRPSQPADNPQLLRGRGFVRPWSSASEQKGEDRSITSS